MAVISRGLGGCIVVIASIVVLELLFGCYFVCCWMWVVGVLVALLAVFDCLSSLVGGWCFGCLWWQIVCWGLLVNCWGVVLLTIFL